MKGLLRGILAAWALLSGALASGSSLEEVDRAARVTYIHGIDESLARTAVGDAGLPFLHLLLHDPEFPRRDNVVAFLLHLGDESTVHELRRFLSAPPRGITTPEEDRGALLTVRALGALARRGSDAALDLLLEMTRPGGFGGILARAVEEQAYTASLRDDLVERAIAALAALDSPAARSRIDDLIFGAQIVPGSPRPFGTIAERARRSDERTGTELSFSADSPLEPVPLDPDPNPRVHDLGLTYVNHNTLSGSSAMTDSRLDDVLAEASRLAGIEDFAGDTACCITLSRSGPGELFFISNLDSIDTLAEVGYAMDYAAARVKVVREINYCSGPGTNILGCSERPGDSMLVVRMSSIENDAKLWIHEYGHNTGLPHNLLGPAYIMYQFLTTDENHGLTTPECGLYHAPNPQTAMVVTDEGACDDLDLDGWISSIDNCPDISNPDQLDQEGDGVGTVCDNCSTRVNPDQLNSDADPWGDACDNCPLVVQANQADGDFDDIGDICDDCPQDYQNDGDGDGHCANVDNCPTISNANQEDTDGDTWGNPCDNCPSVAQASQVDSDGDLWGDACDPCPVDPWNDVDTDGHCADVDNCPTIFNPVQEDPDGDGIGSSCDFCPADGLNDGDHDGHCADADNCPTIFNPFQEDPDGDGIGDPCDPCPVGETDDDADGVTCSFDNCPGDPGNDPDADDVCAADDSCPTAYNPLGNGPVELTQAATGLPSPDGQWFVYRSSDDRLYRMQLAGGPAVLLSATDAEAPPVSIYRISADSQRVVFLTGDTGDQRKLHSVPIQGGTALEISEAPESTLRLYDFAISPDSDTVIYTVGPRFISALPSEIHAVPIDGGTVIPLTSMGETNIRDDFEFLPDSSALIFRAQRNGFPAQVFSVSLEGGPVTDLSPTPDFQASGAYSFRISAGGQFVVYHGRKDYLGPYEIFSVPAGGGTPVWLGPGDGDGDYAITPDGLTVVWDASVLMRRPIDGSGPQVILTSNPAHGLSMSPDGKNVIHKRWTGTGLPDELYRTSLEDDSTVEFSDAEGAGGYAIHPAGKSVLFAVYEQALGIITLHYAPLPDGPVVRITDPSFGSIRNFHWSTTGEWVLYKTTDDKLMGVKVPEGVVVDVSGSMLNGADADWYSANLLDPVILVGADTDADGNREVIRLALNFDPDGDGVDVSCDNCADQSNPDQVDQDGDSYGDPCDCAPYRSEAFPGSVEINDGLDNQCPGEPGFGIADEIPDALDASKFEGNAEISWPTQPGATFYEVSRSGAPDFSGNCEIYISDSPSWPMSDDPVVGQVDFYLARPGAPHPGSWGRWSDGTERVVGCSFVGEVFDLAVGKDAQQELTLDWPPRTGVTGYEIACSTSRDLAGCALYSTSATSWSDSLPVAPGQSHFCLVRVASPLPGSWGFASDGSERVLACP